MAGKPGVWHSIPSIPLRNTVIELQPLQDAAYREGRDTFTSQTHLYQIYCSPRPYRGFHLYPHEYIPNEHGHTARYLPI